MFKIRRGDTIQVIKGKDLGKKGKVIKVFTGKNKAIVEGINMVKKHKRQTRQEQAGGIVSLEAPISISNLMFLCKQCNRTARVGFQTLADGTKSRFCKACKAAV